MKSIRLPAPPLTAVGSNSNSCSLLVELIIKCRHKTRYNNNFYTQTMSKFTNYDVEAQEQEMPVAVAVAVASSAAAPDVASGCDDKAEEDTGTDELGFSLVGFI